MKTKKKTRETRKAAIYHACRLVSGLTDDGLGWHILLHAIREGLEMSKYSTYLLRPKDFKQHPELKELIDQLKESL